MPVQAFLSHAPLPTRHAHRPTISARPALTPTLAPSKRSLCPSTPQMSLERLRNFIALTAAAGILAFAPADSALAARGGGRVGGSSFRAPAARSYSAPSRSYSAPVQSIGPSYGGGYGGYGGGYYGGGMYMTPLLIGGGGGGLGTLVIAGGAAALAYRVLNERREDVEAARGADPDTAVVSVKVGLLSSARQLQVDLDAVARSADTGSVKGLRYVLEEAVLSLLRNPDRWVYGSVRTSVGKFTEAEDKFNRLCMEERLKIGEETLSNVKGMGSVEKGAAGGGDVGEFIVVSLVCAATDVGLSKALPKEINSAADLNRALGMLGGVSSESLQGVEIIWAPQNYKDTLTEREMLADHPELRFI